MQLRVVIISSAYSQVVRMRRLAITTLKRAAPITRFAHTPHVRMMQLVTSTSALFAPIIPFVLTQVAQMQQLATLMQTQVARMSSHAHTQVALTRPLVTTISLLVVMTTVVFTLAVTTSMHVTIMKPQDAMMSHAPTQVVLWKAHVIMTRSPDVMMRLVCSPVV